MLVLVGCASTTSPTGGPKDETPPRLIDSNPRNNQKNFSSQTLELTFSELIKLKDPKEEILITPSVGKNTKFTVRKNKLLIEPEFAWQENTTYSISFRDGVQDLTEGNPAENLRLAFSTGPVIDSLSISGSVREALSEKIPEKITVAIYQADTFNIFNQPPVYFTKASKTGTFSIQNLKSGNYYIYAFDDKNKNLKVDSKTEKFSFKAKPIQVAMNTDSVELTLFQMDSRPLQLTSIRNSEKTSRVRFNKGIDSLHIQSSKPILYNFGESTSELIFYHLSNQNDSIAIKLFAKDSLTHTIDSTFFISKSATKMVSESFAVKEVSETYNHAKRVYTHRVSINKPITKLISDSIYVRIDSARRIGFDQNNFTYDTLRHSITTSFTIPVDTAKKPAPTILYYRKSAFVSIENDTSKQSSKEIKFLKDDETGIVSVKVETTKSNYVIELLSTDDKVIDRVSNTKDFLFRFVKPGDYKVRYFIDLNNNGRWDVGNFSAGKENEPIYYYKSEEGKYTFPIRANWEYGPILIKF
ncbi:MAG: Ig-like domain-containing protein [Cytophagales bacterium]|nr:Ig-like domain-containing protein [Cytophagales bacterium]